jgi:hypothetical protein
MRLSQIRLSVRASVGGNSKASRLNSKLHQQTKPDQRHIHTYGNQKNMETDRAQNNKKTNSNNTNNTTNTSKTHEHARANP